MNVTCSIPLISVGPRANARARSACAAARCSGFARGNASLRIQRAVVTPAVIARAPICSILGSEMKENAVRGAAWSAVPDGKSAIAAFDWIQTGLKKLRTPALALTLCAALAMTVPDAAHAARSGGRVGGSSFRSSGSSSSYSRGSSSSIGSSAGRSYASHTAPSLGMGMPRTTFLGSWGWGMPMGYGMGMGPAVVVGPQPVYYNSGPSLFTIIGFVLFAVVAFSLLTSFMGGGNNDNDGFSGGGERVCVAKLQVGLLGIARSLQKDLEKMADRADTSSPEGLHFVLQETVLSLLRHPDYCVYGVSESKSTDLDGAEELFNEMSMDERSKLGGETLVNTDGQRKSAARSEAASDMTNEYIVVTIIVAAEGNIKLPPITNLDDLRTALKRLGAVRADGVQAVEVLWTPQQDGDTLTQRELMRDYPMLNNL